MRRYVLLSIGAEPDLLAMRNEVFRQAGYVVEAITTVTKALHRVRNGHFDAVILCHTIPPSEKGRLVAAIRWEKPMTAVLSLRARDGDPVEILMDASVHCLDGPEALVSCLEGILSS